MAGPKNPDQPRHRWPRVWPWLLLALMAAPAVWHGFVYPADVDGEFPRVVRPTFSPHPPPSYRLAEPGDTLDRIAIYLSSMAVVLSLSGLARERRRPWVAALGLALAAFWFAANPWPTFDGWHGLAWRTVIDPAAPPFQRLALAVGGLVLLCLILWGVGFRRESLFELWRSGRERGVAGLLVTAAFLTIARQVDIPGVEPVGYWSRCAFALALVAFSAALVRLQPTGPGTKRWLARACHASAGVVLWCILVLSGIELTWYHRPIDRLRTVVPGRIYMSAMPTARGLEVAQSRHHFKTIINLFPEDTPYRSPRLPDELRFASTHNVTYYGSPADAASSNEFLDLTLRVAQDPEAWPILIHCHACMDRTPAWVGLYKFVVEGRPLVEIFRFIEGHRGYRPKATVTLLYNRVLPRLAPERCMNDPTTALLHRCAEGSTDPYYDQVRAELAAANPDGLPGVDPRSATADATRVPSLTPRR